MLEATNCRRIITQASVSPLVEKVRATLERRGESLQVDELPSLYELYPRLARLMSNDVHLKGHAISDPYPPSKLPLDWSRITLYIHSSGSTGLPKSRAWNNRNVLELFTHGKPSFPPGNWYHRIIPDARFQLVGIPPSTESWRHGTAFVPRNGLRRTALLPTKQLEAHRDIYSAVPRSSSRAPPSKCL